MVTMVMISPSRREVSPAEQLCQSPRLIPPRFRLVATESRPERLPAIFSHQKTSYRRRWASESHQGAHEVGGRAQGEGGAPTLMSRVWAPWPSPLATIFFIYFNIFRGVSGLLELRRIGLQYLLLFQSRIPATDILPLHVNLVK